MQYDSPILLYSLLYYVISYLLVFHFYLNVSHPANLLFNLVNFCHFLTNHYFSLTIFLGQFHFRCTLFRYSSFRCSVVISAITCQISNIIMQFFVCSLACCCITTIAIWWLFLVCRKILHFLMDRRHSENL